MAAFFIFVLKSAFVLAMLVSLFMIFMSRETFHRVNRFVMLSIICIALLLPAVNLGVESPFKKLAASIENCFASEESDGIAIDISGFDEQPVFTDVALDIPSLEPAEEKPFDWLLLVAVLYFAGVALLVVRQAVMYVQVARIIVRSRVADASQYGCEGISLKVHSGKEKPFSWFSWVVVSEEDLKDGVREILVHETAHARAGHSWDIMIADAVIIMQWFNPIAWIMKNCLKDIHEFEADEAVINSGVNARQYQLLIIKKAVGARLYSIANSFNHSLTKKRITMMCKEKSKMWRCAKALYIVPVAAIAALAFTTVETVNATESEHLSKGSEFVANNERECIENCISYSDCTVKPQFPGGEAAYREWLDSFSEPLAVKAEGATYDIDFFFVVTKKGKVADYLVGTVGSSTLNHETKKSLNKEFDRMRESLPDGWTPGEVDGKPVDVCMTVKFTNVSKDVDVKPVPEDDEDKVYQVCEKAPEFPGGMDAMMKYLYENIKYPAEAEAAGKDGRAIVQFIVKKDGSIGNVEIIRSSGDNSLDTEAIRVIASMPKWNPGTQGGKPVNVKFALPVVFKVQKSAKKLSGTLNIDDKGSVSVPNAHNMAIVINGRFYDGDNLKDIQLKSEDIESITVVSIDQLTGKDHEKCKALGKKGVIYIDMENGTLNLDDKGSVLVPNAHNMAIVINGRFYDGDNLKDIQLKSEDIESITVVSIDQLTGKDHEKCKALGKKGVIYIDMKKYRFNTLGDNEEVFMVCEQQPEFPGGAREMMKWLSSNIKYPKAARDINVQGKIYVTFIVKADGAITGVRAVNSEYSSNNAKVQDAMNLESHLQHCQAAVNLLENDMKGLEKDIADWERESKVLQENGASADILERRREELEKARAELERSKKRVSQAKNELEDAQQMLMAATNELGDVVVNAYKNSNSESITGKELLELNKTAIVALADEAVRVVRAMPKWNPGMQGGKPVNVQHTLPIMFRLQ